jgi:hypothetical protein
VDGDVPEGEVTAVWVASQQIAGASLRTSSNAAAKTAVWVVGVDVSMAAAITAWYAAKAAQSAVSVDAWVTERQWQIMRLLELIEGDVKGGEE